MRAFHPIQTYGDVVSRVIRVLLVGLVIGISASLCALGMVWLINAGSQWIVETKNSYPGVAASLMTIAIPMIGGLIVGHMVQHMTDKRPQSPADVILAAQSNLTLASLKLKDGLLNFGASIISLACGASLGQYGPIVNMGATLSANLHKIVRTDLTILIGCGVAAAISSAFNAPIAGVIFAHEVILRHYSLRAFAPITISASVGFYISKFVFNFEPLFEIQSVQIFFLGEFAGFTVIGVLAGMLAVLFLHSILYAQLLSNKIPLAQKYKPMIAGLAIGLMALQIPEILGVGENVLRLTLQSPQQSIFSIALLLVAKFAASAICLGFGFAGGVFSPALLIGV
ncbi:MAG: chloride channel protein, partial [Methylococcales bacterium]|nr:chloride channel protein [Methylococcales bacterium]